MIDKRVLVLSNNCFSKNNSNGRTLLNFFSEESKGNLAQFYLQWDNPDFNVCGKYFFASDMSVLKAVFKRKSAGKIVEEIITGSETFSSAKPSKKIARNPITMLIRNFIWNRKSWRKSFYEWVNVFNPECVLLQAGDAPFLYNLAVEIAKKYNIPMAIYNSEDYYFKNYNYFQKSGLTGIFYPFFRGTLKKAVKNAMEYAKNSVYLTEDLKELYDNEFGTDSEYIYTSTDVVPTLKQQQKPVFSYLGNLGLDRHIGLVKIAQALNKIDSNYKLDVYGNIPNEKVEKAFEECEALNYCGVVDYETVKNVIQNSLLIFHTESTDAFYCKDVCHGFSTKIADSLASGTCFVIFAPEMLSCTKYVKENNCGCVITEESELEEKLKEIINNENLRNIYINNALKTVEKNHNSKKNREKFADIINNL